MTPSGTVTVLHAFINRNEGANPRASLIQATDGNFYGTTQYGGNYNGGTFFKMTPSGIETVLHSLFGSLAALIQATDGNFYGTTGGTSMDMQTSSVTVFKMTPSGTVTKLHTFTFGTYDGGIGSLVQATDGNFYGTTRWGGGVYNCQNIRNFIDCGTVFKMTPSGTVTVLHAFTGGTTDGASPLAALIQATDGNFYGTTAMGGGVYNCHDTPVHPIDCGAVFKMTLSGTVTVLHAFTNGTDGAAPHTSLIQATDGNFYGTTEFAGTSSHGTAFKMTPSGTFTVLHAFTGGTDGADPASLIQADGNFYGTTSYGGTGGDNGTVFKMTPSGTITVLHAFTGGTTDGASPQAALIQARDGNFYGTTVRGGASDMGVVFRLRIGPSITGDFDGDGKSDIIVYRPSNGGWYDLLSGTNFTTYGSYLWGLTGDVPVPGDFDGDGKADIAVYRPSNGTWYILQSSTGYAMYVSYVWGKTGDIPVPGDYDGDGKTDIVMYRPSNGTWYVLQSGTSYTTYVSYQWGLAGDLPEPADYDGDGKFDIAVYRPWNGGWYVLQSSTNYTTSVSYLWGLPGDAPVPADYDGDGKTDIAVYRASNGGWYVLRSSTNYTTYGTYLWGLTGDIPVLGDFDGDGKTDIAVYRPSNGDWYILWSSTNYSTYSAYQWGLAGDVPLLKRS